MGAAGFTPGGFPFFGDDGQGAPAVALAAFEPVGGHWQDWPTPGAKEPAYRADQDRKMGVDAGQELSAVALGKRAQMPYGWLLRREPPAHEPRDDAAGGTQSVPR
jgi:hypothetical protein